MSFPQSVRPLALGSLWRQFGPKWSLPLCRESTGGPAPGSKQRVDGIDIHYEMIGRGDHSLLLLPGALGSTRTDFTPQLEGLSKELFTIIAWDPPGFGHSRPHQRDFNNFYRTDASLAAKLMQNLGHKKYSVLGWSDGGITGLILAAHNPDNVSKLVCFGSNAYVTEDDKCLVQKVRDTREWSQRFRESLEKIYGQEGLRTLWADFVDAYCKYDDICSKDLALIKCPTLVLHGDKDPMVASEHPEFLVKSIKNCRLYRYPEGKHNIHIKYAKDFNARVEKFLLE